MKSEYVIWDIKSKTLPNIAAYSELLSIRCKKFAFKELLLEDMNGRHIVHPQKPPTSNIQTLQVLLLRIGFSLLLPISYLSVLQ